MKSCTGLQSHFRSANYTTFIRRRNNFEQNTQVMVARRKKMLERKQCYVDHVMSKTNLVIYSNSLS